MHYLPFPCHTELQSVSEIPCQMKMGNVATCLHMILCLGGWDFGRTCSALLTGLCVLSGTPTGFSGALQPRVQHCWCLAAILDEHCFPDLTLLYCVQTEVHLHPLQWPCSCQRYLRHLQNVFCGSWC